MRVSYVEGQDSGMGMMFSRKEDNLIAGKSICSWPAKWPFELTSCDCRLTEHEDQHADGA